MTLRPCQSLWREGEDVLEERTFVVTGISSHRTWLVRSAAQRMRGAVEGGGEASQGSRDDSLLGVCVLGSLGELSLLA